MIILGIDTSCDDTCIAVLEVKDSKLEIKSNIVSSQIKIHQKYGGVFPSLAKREHQRNLPLVLKKALKEAGFAISNFQFSISKQIPNSKFQISDIDAIAVTIGPGLEPCLWVGINFAKELAKKWNKPIIPINHIEGHIAANFIGGNYKIQNLNIKQIPNSNNQNLKQIKFPAISLIVSGGHTQLVLIRKIGEYEIIGETRDDAAGECFDKTARILGLPYPGGPAIATVATKIQNSKFKIVLPRPMINTKDYDFSFSGLKTAVLYNYRNQPLKMKKSAEYVRIMAKEIQQSIIDVLIKKTIKAAKDFRVKTIVLGGGVAANDELRQQFNYKLQATNYQLNFLAPPKNLCTDNAAMIALAGYFNRKKSIKNPEKISADSNLRL